MDSSAAAAKRHCSGQPTQGDDPLSPPAAEASGKQLQLLTQLAAPEQTYKADFSRYWGGRRNGWSPHALIFAARAEAAGGGRGYFSLDRETGSIRVERDDVVLKIEVWWKGRAPWGYHHLRIVRNMKYSGEGEPPVGTGMCTLSDDECDKQHASPSYCPRSPARCPHDRHQPDRHLPPSSPSSPAGCTWKCPAAAGAS